jgi:hypothetical protein
MTDALTAQGVAGSRAMTAAVTAQGAAADDCDGLALH